MELIRTLNSKYTIKFTEEFSISKLKEGRRFTLNSFDDRKFLFKAYNKTTTNLHKLKNVNTLVHLLYKQYPAVSDYLINKDFEQETDVNDDETGTLYNLFDGEFVSADHFKQVHFDLISKFSKEIRQTGKELLDSSFNLRQTDTIYEYVESRVDKIKDYLEEKKPMFENKFKFKIDYDILDLKFAHIQKVCADLKAKNDTVLNTKVSIDNFRFRDFEDAEGIEMQIEEDSSEQKIFIKDNVALTQVIFENIFIGNSVFEHAATIINLFLDLEFRDINKIRKSLDIEKDIKSIYPKDASMAEMYFETILSFFWIYKFYRFVIEEWYVGEPEKFNQIRNMLVKEKIIRL